MQAFGVVGILGGADNAQRPEDQKGGVGRGLNRDRAAFGINHASDEPLKHADGQFVLKVVPKAMQCFDKRDIETLLHQAKRYMELIQNVDQLQED